MNINRNMKTKRGAFTLVEMMVAMALILFIMVIISQAFGTALETFRQLKGIGDMQESLRTATTLIRADLALDHFDGKRKISNPNIVTERPREGLFFVRVGPNQLEGVDADLMPSYRSPQFNPSMVQKSTPDALYFTIKMRGNRRENVMSHRVPAARALSPLVSQTAPPNFFGQPVDAVFQEDPLTYNSQWAEVLWYLERDGSTDEPSNQFSTSGTPLWALHRAQYLLVSNNSDLNNNYKNGNAAIKDTTKTAYLASAYSGISCYPDATIPAPDTNAYLYFNSPSDVTTTGNAVMEKRLAYGYPTLNATRVLGNVVSFHVRIMQFGDTNFTDFYSPGVPPVTAPDPPPAAGSYDSRSATKSLLALQIIIRVWDPASQQTRQVTIVQDM